MTLDDLLADIEDADERAEALARLRYEVARRRRRAATAAAQTKFCPSCERALPLTDFNVDSTRGDGRDWRCRSCLSKARRRVNEH